MSVLTRLHPSGPSKRTQPRQNPKAPHNFQLEELEARLVMSSPASLQLPQAGLLAGDVFSQMLNSTGNQTVAAPTGVQSPTGHNPNLCWTPQQQAIWEQMRADNSPWWQMILRNANATGTAQHMTEDHGAWATLAYQITGDPHYAALAWSQIEPIITHYPRSGDFLRQNFEQFGLMFNWLAPALNSTQISQYVNGLNGWCEWALGNAVPDRGGFRVSDFDQTVSQYFGMAFVDLGTQGYNPLAGTWLNQIGGRIWNIPIGGLDATGADRTTVRNAISQYMQEAAGGVSVESSMYNLNTMRLLTMGVYGVNTATGVDHFADVDAFLRQAALAQIYELAPNLEGAYQWCDNEKPRDLSMGKRIDILGMLAGFTQDDPNIGPYINQLIKDLAAKFGGHGYDSAMPLTPQMFYLYNPYAASADWHGTLPPGYYASGRGMMYFHDGWSDSSSFFGAQFSSRSYEDHQVNYFGDFQLYRNGQWDITHPIGYGPVADSGYATNSMVIAGLSSMQDRHVDAQQFGANGSYAYIAGTTEGNYYQSNYWHAPPAFLQEWTRSTFYLPSVNGGPDTAIIFDRVNAQDPRTLSGFSHYRQEDQQAIQNAASLDQWIIHSNVAPTQTSNGFTWYNGSQQMQVSTLLPAQHTITTYSDQSVLGASGNFNARELGSYQTRVTATNTQQWETFLNVVQAGNRGTTYNNQLVRSDDDSSEGTLLHRPGQNDTLVMFGALQAGRVLSSGYTVHFTSTTAVTPVYLTDLSPSKTWSISINGGPAQQLTVSSQGVANFNLAGLGADSFTITAT